MTGEVDGANSHLRMDLGVIMEEVSAGMGLGDVGDVFGDTDMTMETIGDGETVYIRAPFFAELGDMMPTGTSAPGASELAALGDGWGSVSVEGLGEVLPEDVAASVAGQQSFNPRAAVEMMENTEGVEELGTEEIDGVTQRGLRAEVAFADLLRTSGADPETFAQSRRRRCRGDDGGARSAAHADRGVGRRRRLPAHAVVHPVDGRPDRRHRHRRLGAGDMDFVYVIGFSDYGEEFSFETPAEATDITSAFADLYAG